MSVIYRRAGELFSFPFTIHNELGQLASVESQGDVALYSDDVFQCLVPEAAVTFEEEPIGSYVAHVDSSNAVLLALVSAACFDDGKIITAVIVDVTSASVSGLGYKTFREYVVGDAPDPSYPTVTGAFDIQVTVTNQATGLPVSGATVTFRSDLNYQARSTPTSGIVTQPAPIGVWRIIVMKNGFSTVETSVTIEEDDDPLETVVVPTIELVSNAVLPPDTGEKLTGWFVAEDSEGNPASGIDFEIRILKTDSLTGVAPDTSFIRATSAANGLVQWNSVVPLYTYHVRACNRKMPGGQFVAPALDDESVVDGAFQIAEFSYLT